MAKSKKTSQKTDHERLMEFRDKNREDLVNRNLSQAEKSETPHGNFNHLTGQFE